MLIRKIELKDLPDLLVLYTVLCEEERSLESMKEAFTRVDKNEDYYLLGVEIDGKIVGTLMGIVCHDLAGKYKAFMTIENVIVLEDYRGRGVARKLFNYIEEIAYQRECRYIYLVSKNSRDIAHKMYKEFGYRCDNVTGFKKVLDLVVP